MPNLSSMGFLQMKTLVFASLLATSASAAVSNTNSNASSAAAATTPPYTFLLKFPDGSLEICPATGFAIGFPEINVDVVTCVADKVFGGTFES